MRRAFQWRGDSLLHHADFGRCRAKNHHPRTAGCQRVNQAVQAAWVKHDAAQCGYCQSGQVMSATALLRGNTQPTDADIGAAMAGNVCPGGTYVPIRAAIQDAAASLA